jgi:hypothetical protein
VNRGSFTAANVSVNSISLRTLGVSGTRSDETTLPLNLGEIAPDARAVLNTRFSDLPFAFSYLLSVSGSYDVGSVRSGFAVNSWISPVRGTTQPTPAKSNTVQKQFHVGPPFPPVPIPPDVETNPDAGPPVPVGPPQILFAVPPTDTLVSAASEIEPLSQNIVFNRDTGTNQQLGVPPDPAAAVGGGVVLATDNTYLLLSIDGGPFTNINPTTIFPNPPTGKGLCCDQVVTYVPRVNLFFWLLQYYQENPVPPNTVGPNRLRIAFATPEAIRADVVHAWPYVDLGSGGFRLSNQWLDYPDLAFTDSYLYVSVDALPDSSSTTVPNTGLIVARVALDEFVNGQPAVSVGYFGPNEQSEMNKAFSSRLTQNSSDTMYWAGHNNTGELWVWAWRDNSDLIPPPHRAKINTYCNVDYSSTAPDNFKWIEDQKAPGTGAVIGATRRQGEVWFAWGAARDKGSCKHPNGRPQPYVYIARIDDQTLNQVGEYDIWNASYAFAFPALATSSDGEIGVSLGWGGRPADNTDGNYGSSAAGFLGDFVVYYNELSDATIAFTTTDMMGKTVAGPATRFGDYFSVRRAGPNTSSLGSRFSSQGYAVRLANPMISKGCNGGVVNAMGFLTLPSCTLHPHYVEWARPLIE